ncbi:hypothetical protein MMC10_000880 [Thelotrema lepadinum]|nr:hypothetical protein [Thelotrema lepadinum]
MAATSLPPPPPGLNIYESRQPAVEAAIFLTWAASLIVVGLRFTARKISIAGIWWDDWLILPAAATTTASTWVTWSMMVRVGVGRHIWALPPSPDFQSFLVGLFISEVLYTVQLLLVKLSILAFYWRIFNVSSMKIPIYIIAGVTFGWAIGQGITVFLQSIPLDSVWDKSITPTSTIDSYKFYYAAAIPSIVTDISCLILPLPYIWKLHVSKAQKLGITFMFVLGGFVVGISFIRLVYLVTQDLTSVDFFWNATDGYVWTIVELNTAVISVKYTYNRREGGGEAGAGPFKPLPGEEEVDLHDSTSRHLLATRHAFVTGPGEGIELEERRLPASVDDWSYE